MRSAGRVYVCLAIFLLIPGGAGTATAAMIDGICDLENEKVNSRFITEIMTSYGHFGGTSEMLARVGTRLEVYHRDEVVVDGRVRVRVDGSDLEIAADRKAYCVPKSGRLLAVERQGVCTGDSILVVTENSVLGVNIQNGRVIRLTRLEYEWERAYGLLGLAIPQHVYGARPQMSEILFPLLCMPELGEGDFLPELAFELLGIIPVSSEKGLRVIEPTSGPATVSQSGDSITYQSEDENVQLSRIGEVRVLGDRGDCRPELALIRVVDGVVVLDLEESSYLGLRPRRTTAE